MPMFFASGKPPQKATTDESSLSEENLSYYYEPIFMRFQKKLFCYDNIIMVATELMRKLAYTSLQFLKLTQTQM